MADWSASMQQTYEFYKVDPYTLADLELIKNIESCTIDRDLSAATLGSASIGTSETLPECYIRVYLKIIQNGVTERFPLGTFLVQTPSVSFDGRKKNITMDAYTPLLELKEKYPPLGYTILSGSNIMEIAYGLASENMRCPVVPASSGETLTVDYTANLDNTWLDYLIDLISCAKYTFDLDETGRVLFSPVTDIKSLQPVWTYDDSNSSILFPDVDLDRDLYGIPNVVEVIYSGDSGFLYSRAVNNDPNSPISTVSRGREIIYRDSNPSFVGNPTQELVDWYTQQTLRNLSTLEYTVKYKHGYCPVRIGDCVRLNYSRAGLDNVKARVISQSIECKSGCEVTETATFTTNLWE